MASAEDASTISVLVTGANSGLGYGICRRLINDFLFTHRHPAKLHIIITTRDQQKGDSTIRKLEKHLSRRIGWTNHWYPGSRPYLENRVTFQQEIVNLTSLRSVETLGKKLVEDGRPLDVVIFNAGIGGWVAIDWVLAFKTILTDWIQSLTWPTFKLAGVGWVTKPQIPVASGSASDEPPLGEVFCANVFGHYMLGHYLVPLLSRSPEQPASPGRIIWVSSIEAQGVHFSLDDLQGIESKASYESSKRLTDILALTADLPSTATSVKQYLTPSPTTSKSQRPTPAPIPPKMYVAHPGICQTSIFPLPFILAWLFTTAIYMTRWLGSIWHTATTYKGACAPVWLALEQHARLADLEARSGAAKWGSACDRLGRERYERTAVDGWGYGGTVAPLFKKGVHDTPRGRKRGMPPLTDEAREDFEALGAACWREMEALRLAWEARLARAK